MGHAESLLNDGGKAIGRERARSDDAGRGQGRDLLAHHFDVAMCLDPLGDQPGEQGPVYREGRSCRDPHLIRGHQQQAAQKAKLGLQQPMSVARIGRLERVGADQFGQTIGLMSGSLDLRSHLVQRDLDAQLGEHPCRLTPCEAATHYRGIHDSAPAAAGSSTSNSYSQCMHRRYSPRAFVERLSTPTFSHF